MKSRSQVEKRDSGNRGISLLIRAHKCFGKALFFEELHRRADLPGAAERRGAQGSLARWLGPATKWRVRNQNRRAMFRWPLPAREKRLDEEVDWTFHRTRWVADVSRFFDYKVERQVRVD